MGMRGLALRVLINANVQASTPFQSEAVMDIIDYSNPKPRVLVVDDEENNREILRTMLEDDGYSVVLARNGREALIKARMGVGIILMDVNMPVLDGIAACKMLQADPVTAHIPLIFLSGCDDVLTIRTSLFAGAYDFLSKPVSPLDLFIKVGALTRLGLGAKTSQRYNEYIQAVKDESFSQQQHEDKMERAWLNPFPTTKRSGLLAALPLPV